MCQKIMLSIKLAVLQEGFMIISCNRHCIVSWYQKPAYAGLAETNTVFYRPLYVTPTNNVVTIKAKTLLKI